MRLALIRQIVALVTVVLFTAGTALSAAASTPHAHQDGETALHHGHAGHQPHAGDFHDLDHAHDHGHATVLDQAPDGGSGTCDHPQHGCFHAHASCCVTALVAADIRAAAAVQSCIKDGVVVRRSPVRSHDASAAEAAARRRLTRRQISFRLLPAPFTAWSTAHEAVHRRRSHASAAMLQNFHLR